MGVLLLTLQLSRARKRITHEEQHHSKPSLVSHTSELELLFAA